MKLMNIYILGCVLLLLLLISVSFSCNFMPHTNKRTYKKYEGMEQQSEGTEDDEALEDEDEYEGEDEYPTDGEDEYPTDGDEYEEEDDEGVMGQIKNGLTGFMSNSSDDEGMMNKLGPNPYSEDTLYDIYGPPTKGSLDCGARSAGLTNSKGPLCLSNKQLNMLKTRGGNASHDAQIGA
jgi:hypothetical protein